MQKLDLRQIGTIFGVPLYIDLAAVHQEERSVKEAQVKNIMQRAFRPAAQDKPAKPARGDLAPKGSFESGEPAAEGGKPAEG